MGDEVATRRRRRQLGGEMDAAAAGEPMDDDDAVPGMAAAAAASAANYRRRRRPGEDPGENANPQQEPQQEDQQQEPPSERAKDVRVKPVPPPVQTEGVERTRTGRSAPSPFSRAPPANTRFLADEERLLLATPLNLNRNDIYPSTAEPHFLIEPPAPEIGEVDASYVELPLTASFRREKDLRGRDGQQAKPAPLPRADEMGADARSRFAAAPSAATEAIALLAGLCLHLAQGALAGCSLLQLAASPWPDDTNTLTRPLAYAPMALPMQRTLYLLAGGSFLAAVDLHACAPRMTSGVMMLLYALVVITCVFELPTSVALHVGRQDRLPELQAAWDLTMSTVNLTGSDVNMIQFVPFRPLSLNASVLDEGGGLFSTALSPFQFGWLQTLISLRAIIATSAWLLSCLVQSAPAFSVPPIREELDGGNSASAREDY